MIDSTPVWVDYTATIAVANGKDFTHEIEKYVAVRSHFSRSVRNSELFLIAYITLLSRIMCA